MRAVVKVLSLLVGLAVAVIIVYRMTHPSPRPSADVNEALETCNKVATDSSSCSRPDFTFAPPK